QLAFLVVGWPLALAVAFVDPRPWSPHTKLTVLGASTEVFGIGLLAADFLGPALASVWSWGREQGRRLAEAIRQLYRPTHRVSALAGMAIESDQGRIMTAVDFGEGTIEELQRAFVRL